MTDCLDKSLRWTADAKALLVDVTDVCTAERLAGDLVGTLQISVEIDGLWCEPERWTIGADGSGIVQLGSVELQCQIRSADCSHPYHWMRARIVNNGNVPVKLGAFRFAIRGNGNDLLSLPGCRFRLYREAWTAVAAAGTVRSGECDFDLDPGYLPFAVSSPIEYSSVRPNYFSAEQVTVLNDRETGVSLLAGFISSADQVTRLAVELSDRGVVRFDAYSYGDGIQVDPGESVASEELIMMSGLDGYGLLEKYATFWGQRMKALTWPHVPTGWCSWYYYMEHFKEEDIIENLTCLADRQQALALEYFQIDDGYQAALGDWLKCGPSFPHGLGYLVDQIQQSGLKPGLWLAPFMVEERSQLFATHPNWVIQNEQGHTVWVTKWRGSRVAVLDCTRQDVQEWLRQLFAQLAGMGVTYVKLDFLMYECAARSGRYTDPKATRAQALRRGLQAIRDGFGDGFILGGTTVLGPVVGLVNGERIGTDITPYWKPDRHPLYKEAPAVANVCRNLINRRYMHHRLWLNDPDVHIARSENNKLTLDEIILWTSVLWLTGGMILLGDRFKTLDPEREKLSRMLLASPDNFEARPLDFFEREYPSIWVARGKSGSAADRSLVVGIFNFEDTAQKFSVDLHGISTDQSPPFTLHDFWQNQTLPGALEAIHVELPPHSCKLFDLHSNALGLE